MTFLKLAWRWLGGLPAFRWTTGPQALDRFEHAHVMQSVNELTLAPQPVYAYIRSWTTVHCKTRCVCGAVLTFHRDGEAHDYQVIYRQNCGQCKRYWSLVMQATLPTYDLVLSTRTGE